MFLMADVRLCFNCIIDKIHILFRKMLSVQHQRTHHIAFKIILQCVPKNRAINIDNINIARNQIPQKQRNLFVFNTFSILHQLI